MVNENEERGIRKKHTRRGSSVICMGCHNLTVLGLGGSVRPC